MSYRIKEIEKDDLYDYMYVNTHSWDETYRGIINDEFLDKILRELDSNVERLKGKFDRQKIEEPDYRRFILYEDEVPVGVFSVCNSREEKYKAAGELACLYLLNKAKGSGYGRIMFEYAVNELKKAGHTNMVIFCLKDNPTNEFYKHMGGKLLFSKDRNIGGSDLIENVYYYDIWGED